MENNELAHYLAALEHEGCCRVADTLKESPHEVTQRVFFSGADGEESGPFIRKLIDRDSGVGAAYQRIYEAQRAGVRFRHLPEIIECYHDERYLVVVMEFVQGETVQNVVYRRDPSLQLARELFPLICDAVIELHELFDPPLIHRDLKPSNVMYDGARLTIIDFGIARDFKQGAEADTVKFGTRAFAPPEQFGFGQTTIQSDVYALGMLLYFCLTEKIPKPHVRDARFTTSDIPTCVQPVLARATALDAAERYANVAELKAAFLAAVSTESSATEGQSAPSAGTSPAGRPRMGIIAGICSVVVVAAVVIVLAGTGLLGPVSGPGDNASTGSGGSAAAGSDASSAGSAAGSDASPADSTSGSGASLTDSTSGSSSAQASVSSTSAQEDASSQSATVAEVAQVEASEAAAVATQDMRTSAPARDGFDLFTNRTVEVAGVAFQVPAYFGEPVGGGEGPSYYYAESGSTCAMLMTFTDWLEPLEDGEMRDPDEVKDGFLGGIYQSSDAFTEALSATDFILAGHSARIATFRGTAEGLPMTTKAVYFYNADEDAIGTFIFGQTDNAQFDYSADIAKSIATATPVYA